MQPEIQISLVIPPSSNVGPFDLYSNVDGYTVPFETGISAISFTGSGYITTPPDGTTFIRVQSTGSCDTFISLKNPCEPTTTTTTSSSTSTSTTTSTTTLVPTTTSTTTSSPTTTTTTTTVIEPTTTTTTTEVVPTTTTTTTESQITTTTTTTSEAPEDCFCITVAIRNDLLESGGEPLYYNTYPCGGSGLPEPINLQNTIGVGQGGFTYYGLCVIYASGLFKYGESGVLFAGIEGMNITNNGTSCSINGDCFPVIPE